MIFKETTVEGIRLFFFLVLMAAALYALTGCASSVVTDTTKKIDAIISADVLSPSHKVTTADKLIILETLHDAKTEIQIVNDAKTKAEAKAKKNEAWATRGKISVAVGIFAAICLIAGLVFRILKFIHVIP